jgi:pimeloyl-ACP methyl ester carboxylesterase
VLQQEHIQQQASNFPQLAKLVTSSVEGMLNEPVSQFLPKIEQPTLVVNGALDVAIPNRWLHPNMNINDVQNASRAIPKSEQVIIPLAGHYLPVDQPQELSTRLNLFRNKS